MQVTTAKAQTYCRDLFAKAAVRTIGGSDYYNQFNADFHQTMQDFMKDVSDFKTTRPRTYLSVEQSLKNFGLKTFSASLFNSNYLALMQRKVNTGIIAASDVLKPALVFKNEAGQLKIIPYGQKFQLDASFTLSSGLTRLDFFKVLDAGFFPLGHPKELEADTRIPIISHDLTGHFGAFAKDPLYMKEIKRFASYIVSVVKDDKEFYYKKTLSQKGFMADFFLEKFKYVPIENRASLFNSLLLPKTKSAFAFFENAEMLTELKRFSSSQVEQHLAQLIHDFDQHVSRLGGIERDDSYQFGIKEGSDLVYYQITDQYKEYLKNPKKFDSFKAYELLADLQMHLINLSRFSVEELVTELTRSSGPQPHVSEILQTESFLITHPFIQYHPAVWGEVVE